jgi:DNA polymerase, archaea type
LLRFSLSSFLLAAPLSTPNCNELSFVRSRLQPRALGEVSRVIFDSYYKGCADLWSRERGLSRTSIAYPPSFYLHLKDPHDHWEMIEGLSSRYKVEECNFNTIFGTFQGHRIFAGRKVAEKIEIQTRYAAELYNVDVRQDQRYMAEKDLFPCGDSNESRFSPDFDVPLSTLEIYVHRDPDIPRAF